MSGKAAVALEAPFARGVLGALDQVGQGIAVAMPERIVLVNDTFCAVTGYPREELTARPSFVSLTAPDEREGLAAADLRRYLIEHAPAHHRTAFLHPSGRMVDIDVSVRRLDPTAPPLVLLLAREVTDHPGSDAQLRLYARRLEILRSIDRGILAAGSVEEMAAATLSNVRELVPCETAAIALMGVDSPDALVFAVDTKTPGKYPPGMRVPLSQALVPGLIEALQHEGRFVIDLNSPNLPPHLARRRDEGVRVISLVALRAGGELLGTLSVSRSRPEALTEREWDVAQEVADQMAIALVQRNLRQEAALKSHLAEAKDQADQLRREAERASKAKSEFLSRMSHELRTPLNAVLGFGQLLEMEELNPRQLQCVHQIIRGGQHLLDLINELLDVSRIEAGRLAISLEPVPLGEVVWEVVELARPLGAEREIALSNTTEICDHCHVNADRQRLKQVILNLVSNAIKYNRRGGSVVISAAERGGQRLRLSVSDTGRGISQELLPVLFKPFERLGADQMAIEGTGLGLTLSKGLIELMGGAIGVESVPAKGSTFWIDLVLVEAPVAPEAMTRNADANHLETLDGPGRTVLYIEDNLSNLRVVEGALAFRPGVKLLSAMQGRLGLELAHTHRPDLILLDLHLPDLAGQDVLAQILDDPETTDIPRHRRERRRHARPGSPADPGGSPCLSDEAHRREGVP